MPAKKFGCYRKILAVVFTSIVAPVVVNFATQEATAWSEMLGLAPDELPKATASQWKLPTIDDKTYAPAAAASGTNSLPPPPALYKSVRQWRRFESWGR